MHTRTQTKMVALRRKFIKLEEKKKKRIKYLIIFQGKKRENLLFLF